MQLHVELPTAMAAVQEIIVTEEKEQEAVMHLSLLVLPAIALHSAPQEYAQATYASLTSNQEQTSAAITMELPPHAELQQPSVLQAITSRHRHAHPARPIPLVLQNLHLHHVQYAATVQA